MSVSRRRLQVAAAIGSIWVGSLTAYAQAPAATEPYKPIVGQAGKDAVWVPTSAAMVEKMLDMAKVTPQDFVIDLGSGDGRTILAAARRGVRGLGVEYNADLVEFSKRLAAKEGLADKADFVQGDMYAADISKASVLALFLLPSNLERLAPKFLELQPGSRIVANTFWITGWEPDESQTMQDNCDNWCTSLLFVVPAKVSGRWRAPNGELSLDQQFQMVSGTFTPAGANQTPVPVKGRLRGDAISLIVGSTEYKGRVSGEKMEGRENDDPSRPLLTATRIR